MCTIPLNNFPRLDYNIHEFKKERGKIMNYQKEEIKQGHFMELFRSMEPVKMRNLFFNR